MAQMVIKKCLPQPRATLNAKEMYMAAAELVGMLLAKATSDRAPTHAPGDTPPPRTPELWEAELHEGQSAALRHEYMPPSHIWGVECTLAVIGTAEPVK
eukprot:1195457-Prorocentrum_minimum.AAC.4